MKKDVQKDDKHKKKHSISLVIRGRKIHTTGCCCGTPTRVAKMERQKVPGADKDVAQEKLPSLVVRAELVKPRAKTDQ